MGEIKSVKVDNWGVFFLQKLQNFFNKTDYCDLTLQFNDNSQLKVHRLVLSACTDYFNVLEQTCEVIDDALLMPNELQADVVVPIVNFMYTGTLEFELKMYGKLLRTAKEMNMTVLLKLLEAHRRTMEGVNRAQQRPVSPKNIRKRGPGSQTSPHNQTRPVPNSPQQQQQQRRILTTANTTPQRRLVQTKLMATNSNQPPQLQPYRNQIGSTSLLKTTTGSGTSPFKMQRSTFESSTYASGTIAHESTMQFKEELHDEYEAQLETINQSTSPFEQLRKGYNNNKRPATATFISPPAKKPNIEDVKEFAEQQRMRKQIAAEYGDDQEYEGPMLDDDIHNDDDDDDAGGTAVATSAIASTSTIVKQPQQGPSIIIKQEPNEKPTIVVKDSANSKMNHAKIISEVLRQYPHLVKSNKNIKLKIMPNVGGGHSQKIIVKKEQIENISAEIMSGATNSDGQSESITKAAVAQQTTVSKAVEKAPPPTSILQQLPRPTQKSAVAACSSATSVISSATTGSASTAIPPQKRRIDSKTMHALIAQGAENTTGPWLCLRCGVNGRPISIPSYRGFRRHLINTHKESIDAALCEHCGWRSTTNRELHFHNQVEHKIKTSVYTFPECLMCAEIFLDTNALNEHMLENHPDENQQQCIYCNKIFAKEIQLYTHMKTYHKKQAIDDGIIDYSDDDDEAMEAQDDETPNESVEERGQQLQNVNSDKKIKILSDISLPSAGSLMKLEASSEAAALTTIASGIATSIGLETSEEFINVTEESTPINTETVNETPSEPKFVTADGNEMVLTEDQRKEIMSQLNQEHEGGVVMVLNEAPFADANVAANTNEDISQDVIGDNSEERITHSESSAVENMETSADEEDYDRNNIYSDFANKRGTEVKKDSSGLEESKGSIDNLEWAENILTAHEMEEETNTKQKEISEVNTEDCVKERTQNEEDISKKLKELTGDWSDDEVDEEMDESAEHIEHEIKGEKLQVTEVIEKTVEKKNVSEQDSDIENESEELNVGKLNKSTGNDELSVKPAEERGENDEPEDDIDIALKSLHQESVGIPTASMPDKIREEQDLTEKSNIKEAHENVEPIEEPEVKNIGLGYKEPITCTAELEQISSDVKEDEISNDFAAKSTECVKNVSKIVEDVLEEINEEEKEGKKMIESPNQIEKNINVNVYEENTHDDGEHSNVDEIKTVPHDVNKDSKSSSLAVETSKRSEETTSSTGDSLSTVKTSTNDKVKTLINDWGDDEDEEEIDNLI